MQNKDGCYTLCENPGDIVSYEWNAYKMLFERGLGYYWSKAWKVPVSSIITGYPSTVEGISPRNSSVFFEEKTLIQGLPL